MHHRPKNLITRKVTFRKKSEFVEQVFKPGEQEQAAQTRLENLTTREV